MRKYTVFSTQDILSILHNEISKIVSISHPYIIGIDGRCGSGKSTLAKMLAKWLGCGVIHTDDFYLPLSARTREIMETPAGHIEIDRLAKELLIPLSQGKTGNYVKFDCQSQTYAQGFEMLPTPILLVEGSYAMHPKLRDFYDLKVFLDMDKSTQKQRILFRNGIEGLRTFEKRWIPLEEMYFEAFDLPFGCDIYFDVKA